MNFSRLVHRAAQGWHHYGNPVSLVWQRASNRPVRTVADRATNLRFECRAGADRMFGEIFHLKVYDIPTAPLRPGDVVLDVGANHGFFTCYAAAQGARVFAFEPDPDTYRLLEANVRRNTVGDAVRLFPWAVGADSGEVELFRTDALGGGMSTTTAAFAGGGHFGLTGQTRVRCVRFDEALAAAGDPPAVRMVKMDCEGAEFGILRTLDQNALDRIESMALEFHPGAYAVRDLMDLILGWGCYHVSGLATGDLGNAMLHLVRTDVLRAWAATL
jgi:FkbM family methyltransferase